MKKGLIVLLLIIICINQIPINVYAETIADTNSKEGQIIFETIDTQAIYDITWATVGFTITRDKCLTGENANGGYPKVMKDGKTKRPNGTILLKEEWKKEVPMGGGKVRVTFTIPKDVVDKALKDAGLSSIKENDVIYLHGIFQVLHKGQNYGSKIYNLPQIMKAEAWRNPDDFKDRFDIKVIYHSDIEPINIEYRTKSGATISKETLNKSKWVKAGEKSNVSLAKTKKYNGKTYTIGHSYYIYNNDTKKTKNDIKYVSDTSYSTVQNRSATQQIKGTTFIAIMYPPKTEEGDNEIREDLTEPELSAIIGADTRGNESFDVEDGIPTTESLYGNVFGSNYLTQYAFEQKTGTKNYSVTVKKTYNLRYKDDKGKTIKESKTVTQTVIVEREFSYWQISELSVYGIQRAELINHAFPGGSLTLTATNPNHPTVIYSHSMSEADHIEDPEYDKTITLSQEISGEDVPSEDFTSLVEGKVKQIKAKNDKLVFNGTTIMSNVLREKETTKPDKIPECKTICGENVLYKSNNTITYNKTNGEYESEGNLTYTRITNVGSKLNATLTYELPEVNNVVIHTPVVCDAMIQDNKAFNQMLTPDKNRASLILDMNFKVQIPSDGYHRDMKGYGYRDYSKYIEKKEVCFPFDVYQGSKYIPKNTWISFSDTINEYYLPIWVDEGKYIVQYRTTSINAAANNGEDMTEDLANLETDNYVAVDCSYVEITGRIYGFNIYDISDYPLWQQVFRKPSSMKLSGVNYTVGINNQNGFKTNRKCKFTLPFIYNNHPIYPEESTLKSGYFIRFNLTTIGNMQGENDYIRIKPRFYFVDKLGNNRQEVDLYYTETIQGIKRHLVKVDSELDKINIKSITIGDLWMSIPEDELINTADIEKRGVDDIKKQDSSVFTFKNIMIPSSLRTFVGSREVPKGVDVDLASSSKQHWYGEYYLPGMLHITPKNYQVNKIVSETGVAYNEEFWLTDGYLILNFEIETINEKERYLSYINKTNAQEGYGNMWMKEGYSGNVVDKNGSHFDLQDGDIAFYYIDKSATQDYIPGGTH